MPRRLQHLLAPHGCATVHSCSYLQPDPSVDCSPGRSAMPHASHLEMSRTRFLWGRRTAGISPTSRFAAMDDVWCDSVRAEPTRIWAQRAHTRNCSIGGCCWSAMPRSLTTETMTAGWADRISRSPSTSARRNAVAACSWPPRTSSFMHQPVNTGARSPGSICPPDEPGRWETSAISGKSAFRLMTAASPSRRGSAARFARRPEHSG